MHVEGTGWGCDFRAYPGGATEWDWRETGTHHVPGVQIADLEELVGKGCSVIVLSRGMELRLQVRRESTDWLEELGIDCIIEETNRAVERYNRLASSNASVGGLFHSTC